MDKRHARMVEAQPRSASGDALIRALPALWMVTVSLGVLLRVSLWAVAVVSIAWGAVMLHYRLKGIAFVAIAAGCLLALFLFAFTVGVG